MKIFTNYGCGTCVLLEEHPRGTLLIAAIERNEYIVAGGPLSRDGSWCWGEYFKSLADAKDEYDNRTGGAKGNEDKPR